MTQNKNKTQFLFFSSLSASNKYVIGLEEKKSNKNTNKRDECHIRTTKKDVMI